MTMENDDRGLVVVTRNGKVAIGNVTDNDEDQMHEKDKGIGEEETRKEVEKHNATTKVMQPLS